MDFKTQLQIHNDQNALKYTSPTKTSLIILIFGIMISSCSFLSTVLIISNSVTTSKLYPLVDQVSRDVSKLSHDASNSSLPQIPCPNCPTCPEVSSFGTTVPLIYLSSTAQQENVTTDFTIETTTTTLLPTTESATNISVTFDSPVLPISESTTLQTLEPSNPTFESSTINQAVEPTTWASEPSTPTKLSTPVQILTEFYEGDGNLNYSCFKYCSSPPITRVQLNFGFPIIAPRDHQRLTIETLMQGVSKNAMKNAKQKVAYLALRGLQPHLIEQVEIKPEWEVPVPKCQTYIFEEPEKCS